MSEIWFEEELSPAEATVGETVKSLAPGGGQADREVRDCARGVVRADRPRWGQLDPAQSNLLPSGGDSRFYLVRLGFQFDIPQENRDKSVRFIYARCGAYLWPALNGQPQPTVYEVIPRDLYEGEQRRISVKVGPQIKLDQIEASLGEVSTDISVGVVEPVVVGWPGEGERAPYWELRPKSKALLGVRHLWLIVDVPAGCGGARLAVMAEGDVQTKFGPIPIGPKSRAWDGRESVLII